MYTGSLDPLNYDELIEFLQQLRIPEGVHIEYKREFDGWSLPKTVSSFANTMGGSLIIGVETDKKSNKPKDPVGFPFDGPVKERINQACIAGIYPPVHPEIGHTNIPGDPDKNIAVVRIAESPEAPHAVTKKTKIYIREAEITSHIKLADIDRIEYLLERRKIPEQRRKSIIDNARDRATRWTFVKNKIFCYSYVVPLFPHATLCTPSELIYSYDSKCEYLESTPIRRQILDGICQESVNAASQSAHYIEVNKYGLVFTLETVPSETDENGSNIVNLEQRVHEFIGLLRLAGEFYKQFKYFGYVECGITLENVRDSLLSYSTGGAKSDNSCPCIEQRILSKNQFPVRTLQEDHLDIVQELTTEIAWCFDVRPKTVENIFRRWRERG